MAFQVFQAWNKPYLSQFKILLNLLVLLQNQFMFMSQYLATFTFSWCCNWTFVIRLVVVMKILYWVKWDIYCMWCCYGVVWCGEARNNEAIAKNHSGSRLCFCWRGWRDHISCIMLSWSGAGAWRIYLVDFPWSSPDTSFHVSKVLF